MGQYTPGPMCTEALGDDWIDEETMCRAQTAPPGPIAPRVTALSAEAKIGEAIERSFPLLPGETVRQLEAMISPESLAIMAGTLLVWAGSHFFGVGEVVDVILLVVGVATLGLSVFSGAEELYNFATTAINAQTSNDLDRAAGHFARAVNILGISTLSAILLRRSARTVVARGRPQIRGLPNVGPAPPPGVRPRITRPASLPSGALGETDWWGNIAVTRNQTMVEQRLTLFHELVHRYFSPRGGPLREIRARVRASGYWQSALLRYLEEALAEGYAQLRVHGLAEALTALRFPVAGGYVTISQLAAEGVAIGNIVLGSTRFTVYVVEGNWEAGP